MLLKDINIGSKFNFRNNSPQNNPWIKMSGSEVRPFGDNVKPVKNYNADPNSSVFLLEDEVTIVIPEL